MSTTRRQAIDWLFPNVRKRVLALLLVRPDERWHLRDIARRTNCALGTMRRELAGLTDVGIILQIKDGNRTYYQANRGCPLFRELSGLMRKTAGLGDVLREALAPLKARITFAFIYGSQASGEATAASDVDLLVVGDVDEMALHRAISNAEQELARPVNYTLLSRKEFAKRRTEKGGFLARVLKGKKIPLLGDADEV